MSQIQFIPTFVFLVRCKEQEPDLLFHFFNVYTLPCVSIQSLTSTLILNDTAWKPRPLPNNFLISYSNLRVSCRLSAFNLLLFLSLLQCVAGRRLFPSAGGQSQKEEEEICAEKEERKVSEVEEKGHRNECGKEIKRQIKMKRQMDKDVGNAVRFGFSVVVNL